MAFIPYSDISDKIIAGTPQTTVEEFLADIEADLLDKYNMTWVSDSPLTATLKAPEYNYKSFFHYWYFKSATSVKIKSWESNYEQLLTLSDDYQLQSIKSLPGVYYGLELTNHYFKGISNPFYIELVGTKGYQTTVPTPLVNLIVKYINRELTISNTDLYNVGNKIMGAKTGESDIKFDYHAGGGKSYPSIIDWPDFNTRISRYTGIYPSL